MFARSILSDIAALSRTAGPLVLAQIGNQTLSFVDSAVAGRYDEVAFAAVGLGNMIFFCVTCVGLGLVLGFDPLVSQAAGASEHGRARELFWQSIWMAIVVSIPLCLALDGVGRILPLTGIDRVVTEETHAYLVSRSPGIPSFLVMFAARSYLQARGTSMPVLVGALVANVVNLPLAILFVFGDRALSHIHVGPVGLPAFGAAGAGLGSAIATIVQMFVVCLAVRFIPCETKVKRKLVPAELLRAIPIGLPIGLTILAEVGIFTLVGVFAGRLGPTQLGAHNAVLQLASLTFQVPLAIGIAASSQVGVRIGRGTTPEARRIGTAAFLLGGAFMLACAVYLTTAPKMVLEILTPKAAVIAAALPIVAVAAAFQLFDGMQTVASGVLRGVGDTRTSLWTNIAGHYAIGLPTGLLLAHIAGWGLTGLWTGLCVGLGCVSITLTIRFYRLTAKSVARLSHAA